MRDSYEVNLIADAGSAWRAMIPHLKRKQDRDPSRIIAVLHNDDLSQVTWELRAK